MCNVCLYDKKVLLILENTAIYLFLSHINKLFQLKMSRTLEIYVNKDLVKNKSIVPVKTI